MYQQYSQYQQPQPAAQQQYYYQQQPQQQQLPYQTTPTSSGGMVWNGSSWVVSSTTAQNNNNNYSSYQYSQLQQQPQQASQQQQGSDTVIPSNPVQTFTQYYHAWTEREKEITQQIQQVTASNTPTSFLQQLQNDQQWAKYYADESSRAAHFFYQNPNATTYPHGTLPIAPTTAQDRMKQPQQTASDSAANATPSTSSSSSTTTAHTGSLTRYMKRNITLCATEAEKKQIQKQIELKITEAMQNGTFPTKNWDEELLLVGSNNNENNSQKQQALQYQQRQGQTSIGNYESPGSSFSMSIPMSKTKKNKKNKNHISNNSSNYYGPAGDLEEENNSPYNQNSFVSGSPFPSTSSSLVSQNQDKFSYCGNSKNNNGKKNNRKRNRFSENGSIASSSSDLHGDEDFLALPATVGSHKKKQKKNHNKILSAVNQHGLDASELTLVKRANRFSANSTPSTKTKKDSTTSSLLGNLNSDYDKYMGKGLIGGRNLKTSATELDESDYVQMTVKGTCQTLAKEYLRLTAPPRPELVRPLVILKQHLDNLKREYYYVSDDNDEETKLLLLKRERTPQEQWKLSNKVSTIRQHHRRRHDYLWFCSQLKAVRQDCTVQRIQGNFAVDVYETHARIALQEDDLNEYNQCQTQLKELYKNRPSGERIRMDGKIELLSSSSSSSPSLSEGNWRNEEEFIAYRLLYYVYLSTNEKYSGGSSDMYHIMLSLTSKQKNHPAIIHALNVREAVAFSDYYRFFRVLHNPKMSPNLGIFLTNLLVPTMQMRGLRRMAKAFRPILELSVCLSQLGFVNDEMENDKDDARNEVDDDIHRNHCRRTFEEGIAWLKDCGGVIDNSNFITKDSEIHEPQAKTKNSLI